MGRSHLGSSAACAALLLSAVVITGALDSAMADQDPLDRTASERLERRRLYREGQLHAPLPGTPDLEKPLSRLATLGVNLGARVMIRIFKAESELEVWVDTGGSYTLFATYPVCYWSGALGPKLREGDKQTPEGFYALGAEQLHHGDRWRRSLNIGYPNIFDRVNGRSGTAILVHGGCDSVGCFAMTDGVSAELYELVSSSLRWGERRVAVHVFPFRMTDANLASHDGGPWRAFWGDLKQGYDSFERTRLPPRISVCGGRYRVEDATLGYQGGRDGRDATPIEACGADATLVAEEHARDGEDASPSATDPSEGVTQVRGKVASYVKRAKAYRGSAASGRCSAGRASCRHWTAVRARRMAVGAPAPARARKRQALR